MIHGDELDGLLIARELVCTLDPSTINGSVRILGVANPLAMEGITRNTPIDMPLEVLLGKPPRMHRRETSRRRPVRPLDLAGLSLAEAVRRVLSHLAIASPV